jgi:hypothetical protein
MVHHTLRDREVIPPALKTIPSSSLAVGEPVLSVFVAGNDTAAWDDKERQQDWQKTRGGTMYPGVVSLIDHDKQILKLSIAVKPARDTLCPHRQKKPTSFCEPHTTTEVDGRTCFS